ncbi:unnamed protein product [Protopolystoma xenopodis]|uniref:Uncharacterized protein n=1 Tax=Protopolystoma xenopodis TaxID=117903 RepID=A0A3S5BQJ9_9PLAT|nr:unnamed protein product [Protopolystoma xenopodis]
MQADRLVHLRPGIKTHECRRQHARWGAHQSAVGQEAGQSGMIDTGPQVSPSDRTSRLPSDPFISQSGQPADWLGHFVVPSADRPLAPPLQSTAAPKTGLGNCSHGNASFWYDRAVNRFIVPPPRRRGQ